MKAIHIYSIIGMLIIALSISGCMMSEKTEIPTQDVIETPITIETPVTIVSPDVMEITQEIEVISLIPADYYNITVDQHFIDHGLYGYLKGYHWDEPATQGNWDFRRVSQLEHELTNKGCNVKIRFVDVDTQLRYDTDDIPSVGSDAYERSCYQPNLDQVSAWLMIELDGEWVAYRPFACYWVFQPDHPDKCWHLKGDKLYDHLEYEEGRSYNWGSGSYTYHNFIDFDNITELWKYYESGKMHDRNTREGMEGKWFNYFNSDEYNATDFFLITFGWWITDEEFHEIETRINKATGWYGYGVDY